MRKEQRTGSGRKGNSSGEPRQGLQKEKSRGELRIAGTYAGASFLKILTADDTDGADERFLIRVILKSVDTSDEEIGYVGWGQPLSFVVNQQRCGKLPPT
jgi:hypothetical protein